MSTVPIIGVSSGLLLGDLFGRTEDAENCLISSSVRAPKIGLSSWLLIEFDPGVEGLKLTELLLLVGAVSDERR